MQSLDSSPVEETLQIEYRRALRDLERVRLQLFEEIEQHRTTISGDLLHMAKGRKGLEEYRKSLEDPHRGTKRGEG